MKPPDDAASAEPPAPPLESLQLSPSVNIVWTDTFVACWIAQTTSAVPTRICGRDMTGTTHAKSLASPVYEIWM